MSGDLAADIKKLKEEPGNVILAQGSISFAQSLVRTGLVDKYCLVIHPAVLGSGLPLFTDLEKRIDLKLLSTKVFSTGAMVNVYQPEG